MSTPSAGHRSIDIHQLAPIESTMNAISKAFDPYGVSTSMFTAGMAWMMHPQELSRAINGFSSDVMALQGHVLRRMMGLPSEDVVLPHADDVRFADKAWQESASWDILKESYLAFVHRLEDMLFETPGLPDKERRRSAFWFRKWLNLAAPTNFFWLNPAAINRCVETKGESLRQGWENFLRDAKEKNILMVEPDAFTVGKDLATTAGKVVFRNRLLELIHYTPTTEKVRETPILIVTPWINKFYILDLTEKKSMVKYLTDQGFSVFITSWKNPTEDMSQVRLDDYLTEGVDEAVRVVRDFCNVPKVSLVGYCIGGTLVSIYMAWANKHYAAEKFPVGQWTLFTTLTDFSHPGDIDVFIDESCINALDESMKKRGYLDGTEMASSFRLLRSNSLIWHYWVHSYLMGDPLPAFDVLFWNMDCTRMPQAMHSYYLREMYLHNNLVKRNHLTIASESIDLDTITQPLYAVTAIDDHIAPWKQCYRIRKYINSAASVRFVLSTSGHILGIVNPPAKPPKRAYWINEPARNDHWEEFLSQSTKTEGTWWEDWVQWLAGRSGKEVSAYPVSTKKYPALDAAPGTYVLEK